MKNLFFSIFAVVALAACGGRLDETGTGIEEDDSVSADMQAQELGGTEQGRLRRGTFEYGTDALAVGAVMPVTRHREEPIPSEINGTTPVLELDFSNGRIEARLNHLCVEHRAGRCHH